MLPTKLLWLVQCVFLTATAAWRVAAGTNIVQLSLATIGNMGA